LILTLTVNPAVDRTITVERLVFEDRAYITSSHESAGGRGINAAGVIHSFGGKATAIVPASSQSAACFKEFLAGSGFKLVVVPVRHDVRHNLIITDEHGLTLKLNEFGGTLDKAELAVIEKVVRAKLDQANWLMICGSLPPGVPTSFYGRLITMARQCGVKTLLDADGDALAAGIKAKPTVVTPNQQEAERLLNAALLTQTHFVDAAVRIQKMGAEGVILSLGSRGAVGMFDHQILEAVPPRVNAIAPIGAGDALAAGYAWAMERNKDFRDALRWGVAAGTASAQLPGMRFANLEQTREIYEQVEVQHLD
jgi:1-phosphofructokinase family hexose kinase